MNKEELLELNDYLESKGYSQEAREKILIERLIQCDEAFKTGIIWKGYECPYCGNDRMDQLRPPEDSDPDKPAFCRRCKKEYLIRWDEVES